MRLCTEEFGRISCNQRADHPGADEPRSDWRALSIIAVTSGPRRRMFVSSKTQQIRTAGSLGGDLVLPPANAHPAWGGGLVGGRVCGIL